MTRINSTTPLLQTIDAARLAGVTQSAISRAAREGRLHTITRTAHGTRLFRPADVEEYRRARIARLARALKAAAEPREGDRFDPAQLTALDLAVEAGERLRERRG